MSYRSAQLFSHPVVQGIASQYNLDSGTDVTFFDDVLPKGSYLLSGVVLIQSSANLDDIYTSGLNGIGASKIIFFGIQGIISQVFAPFNLVYYSDGVEPCDISVFVATAGAVDWTIGYASQIQIQSLS